VVPTASGGPDVRLQPLVRARVAALGLPGRRWAEALPGVLNELCVRWSLRLGRPLPGGSASYLVRVVRADGTDAVLKVAFPEEDSAGHAASLRAADGRGHVRVLAADPELGALLLERLGPSLASSGLGVDQQLDVTAATLLRAWRDADRPALDKAGALAADLRAYVPRLPGAAEPAVVERALAYAAGLSRPDPDDLVLVHGDPHPGNLLRVLVPRAGAETGWCFVDPDPFVADRAYDLGVAARDFSSALLAEPASAASRLWAWCVRVAGPSGVDPGRVWAWALLERVATGLYVTSFGAPRVGEPFLRSATLLVEQGCPDDADRRWAG
jgi:streptomycin 6-kinase